MVESDAAGCGEPFINEKGFSLCAVDMYFPSVCLVHRASLAKQQFTSDAVLRVVKCVHHTTSVVLCYDQFKQIFTAGNITSKQQGETFHNILPLLNVKISNPSES